MSEYGRVVAVNEVNLGDELAADAATGVTLLTLTDAGDFSPTGGSISTDLGVLTYSSADLEANTVTLSAGLPSPGLLTGDRINLYSPQRAGIMKEVVAEVELDSPEENAEPLAVVVPQYVQPLLPVGIRIDSQSEFVEVEQISNGQWQLTEISGLPVRMDATALDPATLPAAGITPGPTTAPASSPAITVKGLTNSLAIYTTDQFAAGTLIEYHLSKTDGFTPSTSTRLPGSPSPAPIFIASVMPDGTPLQLETPYYVRVVATNAFGSAAPSAQQTAQLDTSAVEALVAATIAAGLVVAGRVQFGTGYIDAVEGIVLPQPNGTVTRLTIDGTTPSTIAGYAQLLTASVRDQLNIYGAVQASGKMTLGVGITDPTNPPSVTYNWPVVASPASSDYVDRGLTDHPTDSTIWLTAQDTGGFCSVTQINRTTGAKLALLNYAANPNITDWPWGFRPTGGIVRIGSYLYILGTDDDRSGDWYVYKIDPTTWAKAGEWRFGGPGITPKDPAIGSDGTNLLIAYTKSDADSLRITTVPVTLLNAVPSGSTSFIEATGYGSVNWSGVRKADFGEGWGLRTLVSKRGGQFLTGLGAAVPSSIERTVAGGTNIWGFHFDGTRVWHRDNSGSGRTWQYSVWAGGAINAAYSWYDGDATGGTHETKASPTKTLSIPWGAWATITAEPAPEAAVTDPAKTDKANLVRIYTGGTLALKATLAVGVASLTVETVTGSTAPLGASTFGTGVPASIESTATVTSIDGFDKLVKLLGDGTFRLGNITSTRHHGARSSSATQSVTASTFQKVTWNTVKEATTGLTWDAANNRFVATKPGVYRITGSVQWATNATGRRLLYIYKNGAQYTGNELGASAFSTGQPVLQHSNDVPLAIGDYVEIFVWQNSGGALNINDALSDAKMFFTASWSQT